MFFKKFLVPLLVLSSIVTLMIILFFGFVNDMFTVSTGVTNTITFSNLEIANTSELRTKGLMNRNTLCDTCGMLFVFESEQIRTFWMKNTFISLDIIFMDSDFIINTIHSNTKTNQTTTVYPSRSESMYVLEIPAGKSSDYNLKKGDRIEITNLE